MRNFLIICAIALGFTACEKPAGEGGTSVIEGQVYKIFTFPKPNYWCNGILPIFSWMQERCIYYLWG